MSDPPDATISTLTRDWFVGLEKAELVCDSGGYPKPQNITWTWYHHQPVCCSNKSLVRPCLAASKNLTITCWIQPTVIPPALLKCSLHGAEMCLTTCISHIYMDYHTCEQQRNVFFSPKEGGFLCSNSSPNKSCGVTLRNSERGRYFLMRDEESKRHKEEQETHAKQLIIVPCFKYHSNAW